MKNYIIPEIFFRGEGLEESMSSFDEILKAEPDNLKAWLEKGNLYHIQGDYKKAAECYSKALEISPKAEDIWLKKGQMFSFLENYESAIECFDKAIDLDPGNNSLFILKELTEKNLCKQKKYEKDMRKYNERLRINSEDIEAWTVKGNYFFSLEEFEKSEECYDNLLKIAPNNIEILYKKGLIYLNRNEDGKAIDCYEKILEINPHIKNLPHINYKISGEETSLHRAVRRDNLRVARLLINCGADVNIKNMTGWTPLFYGQSSGVINILLKYGASITVRANDNRTALHLMAGRGNKEGLEILLKKGADVSAVDNRGKTPLHEVISYGFVVRENEGEEIKKNREEIVKMLINGGADPDIKDNKGKAPLDYIV